MTVLVHPADAERSVGPRRLQVREWYGSALIAASLLVHAGALALLVRSPSAAAAKPPAEIPVEVVQMPPAPTTAAAETPPAPKPTPPPEQKSAETPPSKAAAPRSTAAKAVTRKPTLRRAGTPDAPARGDVAERMRQLLGPMPAAVMPTSTDAADNPLDDVVSYRQLVLSQVARQRREDRHNGVPGHVVVAFTLGDAGDVVSCAVREKSVDPALDSEAVAMVYRGAPYPPPPPGAGRAFSFGLAFRPT